VAPLDSSSYACAGDATVDLAWATTADDSCPTMTLILYSSSGSFEANIEAYPFSPGQTSYSYSWSPFDGASYCARTGAHHVLLRCAGGGDYISNTFTLVHATPVPTLHPTRRPSVVTVEKEDDNGGGGGGGSSGASAASTTEVVLALLLGCAGLGGAVVAFRVASKRNGEDDKDSSGDDVELAPLPGKGDGVATRIPYAALKLDARPFAHGGGGLIYKGRCVTQRCVIAT
jgi:hypothetical protein